MLVLNQHLYQPLEVLPRLGFVHIKVGSDAVDNKLKLKVLYVLRSKYFTLLDLLSQSC